MAYYDDDINTADELIREFGTAAQLVRLTTVTPDPDKPWDNPDAPTEDSQPVQVVLLNFNMSQQYFQGTEIPRGAKKILMGCLGLQGEVPLQSRIELPDGQVWKVEQLKLLNPNMQRVLYTIMGVQ